MTVSPVIRLHADDGVLIARASLPPGTVVADGVTTVERIPSGHKVAIKPIAVGEPVKRYGQIIGFATQPIAPGQHVHTQNCGMGDFAKDYAFCADVKPTPNFDLPATFEGIRRPDGRVATRNYIGILTSVNCSAHVAGLVADVFKKNLHRRKSAGRFPQCRRRRRADPQDRLRHDAGRAAGAASPHARRLRAARELLQRHRARPRLRGEPDRRPDGRAEARRPPARDGHPGGRRHPQDDGGGRCLRARDPGRCQQGQARDPYRRAS